MSQSSQSSHSPEVHPIKSLSLLKDYNDTLSSTWLRDLNKTCESLSLLGATWLKDFRTQVNVSSC